MTQTGKSVVLYFRPSGNATPPEKLGGVLEIAERRSCHVQVIDTLPTRADFESLVAFWKPRGVIVECGGAADDVDAHIFRGLPTVFFNHNPATLPHDAFAVFHDQAGTARIAARELLSGGYENFAFVPDPQNRFWSRARQAAFVQTLAHKGKACAVAPLTAEQTLVEQQRVLRRFLCAQPKPCAVFAACDQIAAEVVTATNFVNLRIPADIAILGVDDDVAICEKCRPSLSSIRPNFRRGGNLAGLMLTAVIRTKGEYRGERTRLFGASRVVRRASTRFPLRADAVVSDALERIRREACAGLKARDVAAMFACSRRLADHRFRKATGQSILEAIHAVQLERAQELLLNTHQQLKAISDFCGFKHPNSLRKFFRKAIGLTLTEFRNGMRFAF